MARIFAALLLPADVSGHLDEYVDGVRTAHPQLRWAHPTRWHLTLEFLGECGRHEVDRQLRRWEVRAARSAALRLRLQGAGTFPRPWMARVLWTGLSGDVEQWRRLAGYQQDPHVTIARTKARTDLTSLVAELGSYAGPWWTATEMAVVESHLRGGQGAGPRYEPLEIFPLGN